MFTEDEGIHIYNEKLLKNFFKVVFREEQVKFFSLQ